MMRTRSERIAATHTAAARKLTGRLGVLAAAVFCFTLGGARAFAQPVVSDASYVANTWDDGSEYAQLAVTVTSVSESPTYDIGEVTIPGFASTDYTDCNCDGADTGTLSGGSWDFSSWFDWNFNSSWGISLNWDLYAPTPSWTACTGCPTCSNCTDFSYSYDYYDSVYTEIEVDVY